MSGSGKAAAVLLGGRSNRVRMAWLGAVLALLGLLCALSVAIGTREVGLDDQTAAVLHQRVPHKAEHRACARRLLVKPRLGVGGRGMRGVRALLAPEVDFGITILADGAGHRGGLGLGLGL